MDSLPIQPYDVAMLAVLVLTTLFGLWKGMAWQIASLGSLVVSYIVAMRLSGPLAPYISQNEPWNRFSAMLILYLATSLAIWVLFRLVAGAIDRVRLKEFDRQMGAIIGLAKGCLLCLVITFFAVTLSEPLRQAVLKSKSGKYIALAIQKAAPAMPDEVRDVLGKYIDELDHRLDPSTPPQNALREGTEEGDAPAEGWLPPLASPGATSGQPLDEKIKADISDHLRGWIDRGLDKVESKIDAGLDSLDFSHRLAEPDGTSALVALPGYRVSTSDVLKLRENRPAGAGADSIDGLYRVAGDGSIDLGPHGKLNVAGKRLGDVEREIESRLARSMPGADVLLDVAAAEREVYYVIAGRAGQGSNVWRVRATGQETIEDAIRAAGSPPQAIEAIWLAHPSTWGSGSEQLIPVQWDAGRGRATPNYRIAPGDAVFYSERNSPWSGQAQEWVAAWLEWLRR